MCLAGAVWHLEYEGGDRFFNTTWQADVSDQEQHGLVRYQYGMIQLPTNMEADHRVYCYPYFA